MADDQRNPAGDHETAREMADNGITCVSIDNFYYREFHYMNLRDAIAQAKRDRIRLGLIPDA